MMMTVMVIFVNADDLLTPGSLHWLLQAPTKKAGVRRHYHIVLVSILRKSQIQCLASSDGYFFSTWMLVSVTESTFVFRGGDGAGHRHQGLEDFDCEDGVLMDLNITIIGFDVFNGSFVLLLLWGRFDDDDGESMLINNAL